MIPTLLYGLAAAYLFTGAVLVGPAGADGHRPAPARTLTMSAFTVPRWAIRALLLLGCLVAFVVLGQLVADGTAQAAPITPHPPPAKGTKVSKEFSYEATISVTKSELNPKGGYIGLLKRPVKATPKAALDELRRCFNCSFPVEGAPKNFPKNGQDLPLVVRTGFTANAPVTHHNAPNGFYFLAKQGHFDGAGSTIRFTFKNNQKGQLLLHVKAHAKDPGWFGQQSKIFAPYLTWPQFAENLGKNLVANGGGTVDRTP